MYGAAVGSYDKIGNYSIINKRADLPLGLAVKASSSYPFYL